MKFLPVLVYLLIAITNSLC